MEEMIQTYKMVGFDYQQLKDLAEFDADASLSIIDGKKYPWIVDMYTVRGKAMPNKVCWAAEIKVFEKEIERDMYLLRKSEFFKTNHN